VRGRLSVDWRQASILSDRYLDVILGDPGALLLLAVQAPLIGGLVAGVWSNLRDDSLSLYFVLALSAFFLGAVNSAREIVKERALFLRERMYNLSAGAYVVSKLRVQGISMVVQCTLLTLIVDRFVPLEVHPVVLGLSLVAVALCGTVVGLFISAVVGSADKAVMLVPLVVIPQILFSELLLPGGRLQNWTRVLQKLMPVHWTFELLQSVRATDTDGWTVAGAVAMLVGMAGLGYLGTVWVLARARE
jgi:hypothetical protein